MTEVTEHACMPQPESSILKIRFTIYSLISKSFFQHICVKSPDLKMNGIGTFLADQWLRLHACTAGGAECQSLLKLVFFSFG